MSADDSSSILRVLSERLERVLKVNGFNTDAGANVFLGKIIDPDRGDPVPSITFSETPDGSSAIDADNAPEEVLMEWMLGVDGFIKVEDLNNPFPELIGLATDIFRAVYRAGDSKIGGMRVQLVPVKRWIFPPEAFEHRGSVKWAFKVVYVEEAEE